VKLADCQFLADENIHGEVVAALRAEGRNVVSVGEAALVGQDDASVPRLATEQNRVVLTHDSDFGRLVVADGVPYIGIV
jgi:predicted nuclease of predicted toxin-antitoxin system